MCSVVSRPSKRTRPSEPCERNIYAPHRARRRSPAPWIPFRGFRTPGELLEAVREAEIRPSAVDERLRPLAASGSDEHATYAGPTGGFLVPDSMAPFVANVHGGEEDPAMGRTLPVPMSTPVVHVAARVDKDHSTSVSSGLFVYRRPETTDITRSRMQYERITLDAHEAIGLSRIPARRDVRCRLYISAPCRGRSRLRGDGHPDRGARRVTVGGKPGVAVRSSLKTEH